MLLSDDRVYLKAQLPAIHAFLHDTLKLTVHPDKIVSSTVASGVDYLGWVHFPHHRVLRTTTKRRMFSNVQNRPVPEVLNSYLGLLSHGATEQLQKEVKNTYWLCAE